MQTNPSRTIPVVVGFTLYLLLMGVIFLAGFVPILWMYMDTIINTQLSTTAAFIRSGQVSQQFDRAQIAALRFRETNEQKFAQEGATRIARTIAEAEEFLRFDNHPDSKFWLIKLIEPYRRFEAFFLEEVKIGEEIKRTEAAERLAELYALQQEIRQQQDAIAEEARALSNKMQMTLKERQSVDHEMINAGIKRLSTVWCVCCFVAVILGIIICFVVVVLVNRQSTPVHVEGLTSTELSDGTDLYIIADRLQEVVNLLRK